ncbi:hypothetical protein ACIP9H_12615 [Streptomyces sp. NPDC088732]
MRDGEVALGRVIQAGAPGIALVEAEQRNWPPVPRYPASAECGGTAVPGE